MPLYCLIVAISRNVPLPRRRPGECERRGGGACKCPNLPVSDFTLALVLFFCAGHQLARDIAAEREGQDDKRLSDRLGRAGGRGGREGGRVHVMRTSWKWQHYKSLEEKS